MEKGIRQTTSEVMGKTYDKHMRGADAVRYFVEKMLVNNDTSKCI
jgi:hypothetical protein